MALNRVAVGFHIPGGFSGLFCEPHIWDEAGLRSLQDDNSGHLLKSLALPTGSSDRSGDLWVRPLLEHRKDPHPLPKQFTAIKIISYPCASKAVAQLLCPLTQNLQTDHRHRLFLTEVNTKAVPFCNLCFLNFLQFRHSWSP